MSDKPRIICPVDLSDNSLAAIDLATTLAKHHAAELVFLYVSCEWLPDDSLLGSDFIATVIEEDEKRLESLRPSDDSIAFQHIFIHGNPGPEIVRFAKPNDTIVMSTHGDNAFVRFLVGSVAQYTMRNAPCPVVTLRVPKPQQPSEETDTDMSGNESVDSPRQQRPFVTRVMHQVHPVHNFDKIEDVVDELKRAKETAAPVVDESGTCIGILTTTDIDNYLDLKRRFDAHDETVLDEIFDVDSYGQRRPTKHDFDQVKRHMTSPVVTISSGETCQRAEELFKENPSIHHLVVVDESNRAVGIVEPPDVVNANGQTTKA